MKPHLKIVNADSDSDFEGIIMLQSRNLKKGLPKLEWVKEGFVTAIHSHQLLKDMNTPYPHSIAKTDDGTVVGYALTMLPDRRNDLAVLVPMFEMIDSSKVGQKTLGELYYVVMGQVCIAKDFRRMGLFRKLYDHLIGRLGLHYDYMVTEVATSNVRSLEAHKHYGFEELKVYTADELEWSILFKEITCK